MPRKNLKSSRPSAKSRVAKPSWRDPDDAPEITDAMLARATLHIGGKVIQRGRPPLGVLPKKSVTLRLDADVVDAYRATGSGWQSRINADLVKTAKRLKA